MYTRFCELDEIIAIASLRSTFFAELVFAVDGPGMLSFGMDKSMKI
jgi:hypothetical protein